MRHLRQGLNFSNVVAVMALFVALGGSSYAVMKVSGKDVKNGSLTGKDIKRNSLTGKQIKESKLAKVRRAGTADFATGAGTAATAQNAQALGGRPAAQVGGVRAYARVDANGDLVRANSKNVVSVSRSAPFGTPQENTHCFELGFTPKVVVGMAFAQDTGKIVSGGPSVQGCPAGTDAVVYTVNDAGDAEEVAFDVMFE